MNTRTIIKRAIFPILSLTLVASVNCSNARTSNAASPDASPNVASTNEKAIIDTNTSSNPTSATSPAQAAPEINVEGSFASSNVKRGRLARAQVVLDVPDGYHVNANRPLGKYAIPTVLKISAPAGVRVSPVIYPRSTVRTFKFSNEKLAVYEGRAVMRFNVIVPTNYKGDRIELKANLRFQSCNDEVCFPPKTRNVEMAVDVK